MIDPYSKSPMNFIEYGNYLELQAQNLDLRAKLAAANTRIGTLEMDYDILKGQTGKLKAKLTAAEHKLRGRETKIETLQAYIDAAKGEG